MRYYEVALVKSARSASGLLTYHSAKKLHTGAVVSLKVRDVQELGVIVNAVGRPDFKTRQIEKTINVTIDDKLIKLTRWISQYYQAPIGVCVRLLVPAGLQIKRREKELTPQNKLPGKGAEHKLTKEQSAAIKQLSLSKDTSLLYGVTGSGKTHVYIKLAKEVVSNKQSVIVLVPEISLTTQLVKQFRNYFDDIFVTHSNMTESERHRVWKNIYESDKPQVVIGPRSALFMPVSRLGLIVIDECHDDSYKQDNSPRYNTLKVARKLCDINNAKLILGSATPSVTDYYLADQRSAIVELANPIKSIAGREVSLIDMKVERRNKILSREALAKIKQALEKGEQTLIYHNRRGTSPLVICSKCAWTANCPNCFIPMVLHQDNESLKCHNCGRSNKLPTSCPKCSNTDIVYKGFGTKKIEQELHSLFPAAQIARFDTDNKKAESLAQRYHDLHSGKIDILVGTQMIAKGLDLPKLNTGVVVSADTGLSIPDFGTNEKVFQLLHQVVGRVGRHSKKSYVGIQTFAPKNLVIQRAKNQDYAGFYEWALSERKAGAYPPFRHLLLLTCAYASRATAKQVAQKAMNGIERLEGVTVVGPAPSFHERRGNKYRWQILVKSSSRNKLVDVAKKFLGKTKWAINIDPVSLL